MARPKRKVMTLDCETDPFSHGDVPKPFIWDVYDGAKHWTFEHASDMLDWLTRQHAVVFAHNGGRFDYLQPGAFIDQLEDFQEVMVINGRLAKFTLGECEFRDSFCIYPQALDTYKKLEIDYGLFVPEKRKRHMAEITRYLHQDTESLHELVVAFREQYGDSLTLAGASMKTWEKMAKREAPESSLGFYNTVAPFYHGGRVDCFKLGIIKKPFRMVDINSAYPYAMTHKHPFSVEASVCCPKASAPIIPQSMYRVIAVSHGALPFINAQGSMCFPNDDEEREFFCGGWEIGTGLFTKTLTIKRVVERVDFAETVDFTDYIEHFYKLKSSAEKGSLEYLFAKLMMNANYGKWGANPQEYARYEVMHPKYHDAAVQDGYTFGGELGQWCLMKKSLTDDQMRFYNVATAASITSFVRAYLFQAIHAIREAGGEVLYCDTDSIAFSGSIPDGLTISKDLGDWSDEGEFDRGGIGGKKLYAFHKKGGTRNDFKMGCKGVDITAQDVLKVCKGQTVTYKRDAPTYSVKHEPRFCVRKVRMTGCDK